MDRRAAGVLLPIFSLPGPFAIGCFGDEAVDFATAIRDMGFTYWQILPLNPPAGGNSPYQCYSAFAGNPLMIDLRELATEGLLTAEELSEGFSRSDPRTCDYTAAALSHLKLLKTAFERCDETACLVFDRFAVDERPEIMDYALFMSIRDHYGGISWHLWPDESLRHHDRAALDQFAGQFRQTVRFHLFCQYWFFRQWHALRQTVNDLGVRIMGDLPIYLAYDSCDVWANQDQFELDDFLNPIEVSGVPPDYFTEDGQLWGNPLYDWEAMKKDGYAWWIRRIQESFRLFDLLRLDHFRGFANYWAVPNGETTARNGRWRPGPGMPLFDAIYAACPQADLVAEDLGASDDGTVAAFLEATGLPGMRVLQFGFDVTDDNGHLVHNHTQNSVAYSSTHDNNTLLGWLFEAAPAERDYGLSYVGLGPDSNWTQGGPDSFVIRTFLRVLWQSTARLVIVPVQDMLGYGADTRINTPGQPTGQWRWRVTEDDLSRIDRPAFLALNRVFRREIPELPTSDT